MNAQVGERYRCSDSNCGCEIEVTSSSRTQDESYGAGAVIAGSQSRPSNERPIGGSTAEETGVGSLRNAESATISTPGDFGSQGATGEGVFGTSGGNQRSTASGRLGSTTGSSSRSGSQSSSTSSIESGSAGESNLIAPADSRCTSAALQPRSKDVISRTAESNSTKIKRRVGNQAGPPFVFKIVRIN